MSDASGRSLEVEGISHGAAPIPMGARVGPLLCSSGIPGLDPRTGKLPASAAEQARHAFANLRALLAQGGATFKDVAKLTAYIKDNQARDSVNAEWVQCFPDPHDRPARHTLVYDLQHGMLLQLEAIAYVAGSLPDAET